MKDRRELYITILPFQEVIVTSHPLDGPAGVIPGSGRMGMRQLDKQIAQVKLMLVAIFLSYRAEVVTVTIYDMAGGISMCGAGIKSPESIAELMEHLDDTATHYAHAA